MSRLIAVIDTETTWIDKLMSIGVVIADYDDFSIKEKLYYILTPEYKEGGMFSFALDRTRNTSIKTTSRQDALNEINNSLKKCGVKYIFAYNAHFDYRHLEELNLYCWIDIMKIAAYKQYNYKLPDFYEYCKNGRLKRGYGVQEMYRILSGCSYYEEHNAICDAEDELEIIKMLEKNFDDYLVGIIETEKKKTEFEKLKEDYEKLTAGDYIIHDTYGEGIIINASNRNKAVIKFGNTRRVLSLVSGWAGGYIKKKY
jgi:transcription-repair coupling factor (superfamily II helicase)